MNSLILAILLGLLMSCASRQPIGTQVTRPPNQKVQHDYLNTSDLRRVRHPEFVKTYHVGRIPTRNGQLMHEAHRVYKLEKSPRWNLLRNNPSLRSTGPVRALRDSAFRPLPLSQQVQAEKQRQRELTEALAITHRQTADQLDAIKVRATTQDNNAKIIHRLTQELKRERQARLLLETQAPSSTSHEPINDPSANTKALKAWGNEQP